MNDFRKNPPTLNDAFDKLKAEIENSSTLRDARKALSEAGDKMQNAKDELTEMYDLVFFDRKTLKL